MNFNDMANREKKKQPPTLCSDHHIAMGSSITVQTMCFDGDFLADDDDDNFIHEALRIFCRNLLL